MSGKTILFVAEAVTLAHVARPLVLSAALPANEYDLAFACDPRSEWVVRGFPGRHHALRSIESSRFLEALHRGAPLYDEATLERYVRDDLELIEKAKPDAIVGDFRLSLSVSARLAGVPYLAISNCYWSPHWTPRRYTVPSLALTRFLPIPVANALFRMVRPIAFALHSRPLDRVRRRHGLPSLGTDLRRVYTDADRVLYADVPALFPGLVLPPDHEVIGPILWSPPGSLPEWWNRVPDTRPVVYLTLGSSGQGRLLPEILRGLARLDVTVIAAAAGAAVPERVPANVFMTDYLPGEAAARRAALVICNGGSPTSQQALAAGVPVIGIAGNLDQFLNMATIESVGAGAVVRADRFAGTALSRLVRDMIGEGAYRTAARRVGAGIDPHGSGKRFAAILRAMLGGAGTTTRASARAGAC